MKGVAGSQAGLTLVELLVAVTVLALSMGIALMLYDNARASYKIGDNLAEQQQTVRVASDRLTAAIRMAGFNTNPDGNRSRPDEQIEAAYATAIFIRADFDFSDRVASRDPESTLDNGAFPTVTTGNDEIIGYVLAKEDGSSTETITLWADVGEASRDGDVERVDIGNVELLQDEPPYTLYKIWMNNDPAQYGGAGFVLRAPLADNVRALRFRYYDANGTEIAPPGGSETDERRADRAAIRRITIDVVGQTRDPLELAGRVDRDDPDPASRGFLKFKLSGDVSPRNLGKTGIPNLEADVTPPSTPAAPQLYPGHCGGLLAGWTPNPAVEQSPPSPATSGTTDNFVPSNTPIAPLNPSASLDLNGRIERVWEAVGENLGALAADPMAPLLRDLAGYRVYRGDSPGVVNTLIAEETSVPAYPRPKFSDTTAVNCRPRYYEIRGVDRCGAEGEESIEFYGRAQSSVMPQVPGDIGAYLDPGAGGIRFEWQDVQEDIANDPIHIDSYIIGRAYPGGALRLTVEVARLGDPDFNATASVLIWVQQGGD